MAEKKADKEKKVKPAEPKTDKKDKEIAELKTKIEQLEADSAKQKDLLLRTAAEFDNFKRRTEKASITSAEYTKATMLKKLLPVFDNVERAGAADKESADYSKGIEMTVKLLCDAVVGLGMVEIGAEGEKFDPSLHEAVMHIDDESLGENTICKVLQKGYKIGDTVIRPAMVQVAN